MRRLRHALVVGFVMLGVSAQAEAGPTRWLAWLEELSGPGPFVGFSPPLPPIYCLADVTRGGTTTLNRGWVAKRSADLPEGPCVTTARRRKDAKTEVRPVVHITPEIAFYHSMRNRLAPAGFENDKRYEVKELAVGLILYNKAVPGVDLGVGVTYHRFSGDGEVGASEGQLGHYVINRGALSLRARIRPLTWIDRWRENKKAAAFGVYTGLDQMEGSFTNEHFKSRTPFSSRVDTRLMKVSVLVDAWALFH